MALADRTRAKVMHYGEHICARTTGVNRGHVDKSGRQQKHQRKTIPGAVFDRQRKDGLPPTADHKVEEEGPGIAKYREVKRAKSFFIEGKTCSGMPRPNAERLSKCQGHLSRLMLMEAVRIVLETIMTIIRMQQVLSRRAFHASVLPF